MKFFQLIYALIFLERLSKSNAYKLVFRPCLGIYDIFAFEKIN